MISLWGAFILGIVEGLTEFLPVSSTGHLIVVGDLLGFEGPKAATFEIVIQFGAILAIIVVERRRFAGLLRPATGSGFSGLRGSLMLGVTTFPILAIGYLFHAPIKDVLFRPGPVAVALLVGGLAILVVERFRPPVRIREIDDLSLRHAALIGLFQCLALWPGMSRAASTILGGLLLGIDRRTAATYSFMAAVPALTAATAYDLLKNHHLFQTEDWMPLAVGLVVSFLAAWVAVRSFVALLGRVTLRPFGWYRIAIAPLIFWFVR